MTPITTSNAATVDQLFNAAFAVPRDPRSPAYLAGVRAALTFRIEGAPIHSPYTAGTAEGDAFDAGVQEGHSIWRRAAFNEGAARPDPK